MGLFGMADFAVISICLKFEYWEIRLWHGLPAITPFAACVLKRRIAQVSFEMELVLCLLFIIYIYQHKPTHCVSEAAALASVLTHTQIDPVGHTRELVLIARLVPWIVEGARIPALLNKHLRRPSLCLQMSEIMHHTPAAA